MKVEVGSDRWRGSKFVVTCLMLKLSRTDLMADAEAKAAYDEKSDEWKDGFNTAMDNAIKEGLIHE